VVAIPFLLAGNWIDDYEKKATGKGFGLGKTSGFSEQ